MKQVKDYTAKAKMHFKLVAAANERAKVIIKGGAK